MRAGPWSGPGTMTVGTPGGPPTVPIPAAPGIVPAAPGIDFDGAP